MGYYDQDFLNYYYYMASQFAVVRQVVLAGFEQGSVPNRLSVCTGGTAQGLVFDPGSNDNLPAS